MNFKFTSFEHTVVKLFLKDKSIVLISIYRVLFVPVAIFITEITELLEVLSATHEDVIVAGDINIHMEENELYSNQFNDILSSFNFVQHVKFPTHKQGHTLDIVATNSDSLKVTNLSAHEYDISHHYLVDFCVELNPEVKHTKIISYRNLKGIDPIKFNSDITRMAQVSESLSFEDNIKVYNETLKDVLNKHAPIKSKTIKIVPKAPWFDCEYEHLRKLRRKEEKRYRKTKLLVHKESYKNLRKQTTNLAYMKKCKYYGEKLIDTNNRTLYPALNQLLDKKQDDVLPDRESDVDLANCFLPYFTDKIEKIRATFPVDNEFQAPNSIIPAEVSSKLTDFDCVTEEEIKRIVLTCGVKCSPEDPLPATLLKNYVKMFLPIWTRLVNLSLREGSMECLKNAVVLPLFKEMDDSMVDKDNLKNYRPVSNLLFVGKLIERVVAIRLKKHMTDNNLHSDFQYGFKPNHSTETLLLTLINDLLIACDNQMPSILMLLDLSAAFDTVDQEKLLSILQHEIGVEGTPLKWLTSYLKGRTQEVKIGESFSEKLDLKYGVAQGSVLGPDLFNIYVRTLQNYVEPSTFSIFGFADDHQLLKIFLPALQVNALGENIQNCFKIIGDWMNKYFLQLNTNKTKILVVMPPSQSRKILIHGTFINGNCVRFVPSAKNLGVILDDELTFKHQIQKVMKSCFLTIRKLSRIKNFLTYEQLRTVVYACVLTKLDYCNSLYFGINANLLNKLQLVQNSAVRLLRKKGGFNNLSTHDCIRKCHWLPIRERIIFKTCLIVHKCLLGVAPLYLQNMIKINSSNRTRYLVQPLFRTSFAERSFSRIGPKLWNLLPLSIRGEENTDIFKRLLKTFLFDHSEQLFQKLAER